MKQCPACRRLYSDDSLFFCLEDGTMLVAQTPPVITQRYTPPAAENVGNSGAYNQPSGETLTIDSSFAQATGSRRRGKLWIIPVAAALFLIVAGGTIGAYFLLKSRRVAVTNTNANIYKAVSNSANNKANSAAPVSGNSASNNRAVNNSASNVISNAAVNSQSNSSPEDETITSDQLVGTWESDVVEQGAKTRITYTLNADGTSKMFFKSPNGQTGSDRGTWGFSDPILNERFADGTTAKGSIRMLDADTFEITIIDNGVPAYKGVKRIYRRKK